jgi:hypothetical protein
MKATGRRYANPATTEKPETRTTDRNTPTE